MPTHELLHGLGRIGRTAATLARLTGWSLSANQKRTMLTLSDPTHQHKVVVPYGSVNASRADSILRQVVRYTPMPALAGVLYGDEDMLADDDAAHLVTTLGPVIIETILDASETWDEIPRDIRERFIPADHPARRLPGGPDHVRELPPPTEPTFSEVKYRNIDSADIWVRVYSDGRTVYLCRDHPEWEGASVASLGGHIKGKHTELKGSVTPITVPAGEGAAPIEVEGGWQCPECDRVFGRPQALGMHRRRSHGVAGQSEKARVWREKKAQEAEPVEVPTVRQVRVVDPPKDTTTTMSFQEVAVRIHGEPTARIHWAAHRGGRPGQAGTMYESQVVDQVTYADGHIGYVCQHCDEFASDQPRPVARHAGRTHPHEAERDKAAEFAVPEYEATGIHRKDTRLLHVITEALDTIEDWPAMTAPELAEKIADYVVDQRPEREPVHPLTDQEVLERIVRLVDRGQYASLQQSVTDLSGQIADLAGVVDRDSETINELEHDRDEALRRNEALLAERTALRDMLGQVPS